MYRSLCMVLVLFVASGSTFNWELSDEDIRIVAECEKSNEKTRELSQNVNSAGTIANLTGPNEPHSRECFLACYIEKLKLYDDNGALDEAVKKQTLDDFENGDEVVDRFRACSFLPSDNCGKKAKSFERIKEILINAPRKKKEW